MTFIDRYLKQPTKAQRPGCGLILGLIILAWAIELVDFFGWFNQLGIRPRSFFGLIGIPLAPVLHGGLMHLLANTLTFVVLGAIVLNIEQARFLKTTWFLILLSGLGTWLLGRSGSVHIGASSLIYGYFGFILMRAFLEKRGKFLFFGILVALFYGGMLFGVFPTDSKISWEGHLSGFISGLWLARRYFKLRPSSVIQV